VTSRCRIPLPLLLGIATVFGVSSSVQSYLLDRVSEGKSPDMLLHIFILNIVYWYVPALLAPVIVNVATRYRLERKPWYFVVPLHIAGAFLYSIVHTAAMFATRMMLMPGPPPRGWWFVARIEYLRQLDWLFMTYLFLVGLAHALAYRRESERRALASAQLEMRLVEAQLQALQRQLHPHFLFNTLNAIAGLMRTDVDAADRMMDRLGDLLRMTLQSSNLQELPLKEELELLQKYLDIEQTRFGNRLSVSMDIDPETLDAQVPNFLLQPLVENAVRHGIVPHTRSGRIVIESRRTGNRLMLEVVDSGNGVPPHRLTLLNQGVGLANTRARLEHLYRNDHTLLFSNDPVGFRVTVSIPFVVERDEPLELEAGSVA
jgi:signal transduction histidine kinase